jgi:hypothetical protein
MDIEWGRAVGLQLLGRAARWLDEHAQGGLWDTGLASWKGNAVRVLRIDTSQL